MSESRLRDLFLDTKGLSLADLESFGTDLVASQKGINWWLGDCARAAERLSPDNWSQAFPEGPPDLLQRCMAVAKAYPREGDRSRHASWTIHMREANWPDRIQRVQAHVDAGRTSDEAAKANREERADDKRPRWLLAVDVHLFVHKWYHQGNGVETAMLLSGWIQRTVERLKAKGLTDAACCFDGRGSFRKELTEGWEDPYKGDRGPKEHELIQQLDLTRELLGDHGFACLSVEGYEADDILASFAVQFPGKVTLLSSDKDVLMCLSRKCNLLRKVEWTEDETSGDSLPTYHWVTAASHVEDGCPYNNVLVQGIRPDQWAEFQTLAGDPVDNVSGARGIGATTAAELIKKFGTAQAAVEAAKAESEKDEDVCQFKPAKRKGLMEFEAKLGVTRQLVTLIDSLPIPSTTRI